MEFRHIQSGQQAHEVEPEVVASLMIPPWAELTGVEERWSPAHRGPRAGVHGNTVHESLS
jgi:hypothetical protein